MRIILEYIDYHLLPLFLLFIAIVSAVICIIFYFRQRERWNKIEQDILGEREFYHTFAVNRQESFLVIQKSDLRILYISPNFEQMTGIPGERVRADIEVLKNMVTAKEARNIIKQLKEWDGIHELKLEFAYKTMGNDNMAHGYAVIQPDEENVCYLAAFGDNTQDYKIRSALKEQLEQAYQESQAKTDFLSKMSHEIRTPMNGILGMLSLAKVHVNDPKQTSYYLERAESLSQFLLTLINDILDMSRIESGKMELEQIPFDLYGVAEKLDSMFRSTTEAKQLRWDVQMQDFDVCRVIGDELRLTQVIINFISNAVKFTPPGGAVTVTFRQMHKIDGKLHLMIRVRDTGKGIKSDFISRIFRPFEQEDASTAHHYGGSGLGMAIADNIVKLMQGEIIVESEEGKGTEFVVYVSLPIAEGDQIVPESWREEKITEDVQERKKIIDDFTLDGVHILLAEDNVGVQLDENREEADKKEGNGLEKNETEEIIE